MNKNELNNILKEYYSFSDVAMSKLNIDDKQHFDLVIVSPTWKPHFVFNEEYSIENLKTGSTSTFILYYNNKKILFIKTGKGAPNMFDNLLLLRNIDAPYIFLGSTGSLDKNVHEGDIFIPYYSISGDGASLYFEKKIDTANFFNKMFFSTEIKQHIESVLKNSNFSYKNGGVYSTDTLIGEYYHMQEIMKLGATCIEQESASFGKCMKIMEKEGCPILVISDSLITGTNYYEPIENKQEYLSTRTKKLQKIISKF